LSDTLRHFFSAGEDLEEVLKTEASWGFVLFPELRMTIDDKSGESSSFLWDFATTSKIELEDVGWTEKTLRELFESDFSPFEPTIHIRVLFAAIN